MNCIKPGCKSTDCRLVNAYLLNQLGKPREMYQVVCNVCGQRWSGAGKWTTKREWFEKVKAQTLKQKKGRFAWNLIKKFFNLKK
jgi:hypothetical protein